MGLIVILGLVVALVVATVTVGVRWVVKIVRGWKTKRTSSAEQSQPVHAGHQ